MGGQSQGSGVTIEKNALPSFKIQQPPNAVGMIVLICTMLAEQSPQAIRLKEPATHAAVAQQHIFD